MAESLMVSGNSKQEKYESLIPQIRALVLDETDLIANLANIVAALKFGMGFFWVGVYFVKESVKPGETGVKELVLGPFQGPIACTRIPMGKGVCGTAWKEKRTIIVPDVDQFPGHIVCSTSSKSEIVLPALNTRGEVVLVLDIDSDQLNDFGEVDERYLSEVVTIVGGFIVL